MILKYLSSMFKKIKKPFIYKFNAPEDGLYSVSMEASCKSGRLLGMFGGQDLRVEIDGLKLREIPPKWRVQYFNIPPSWNGTKLKGLSKTIIFVLRLTKGEHELKFIPKKGAVIIKEPVISPLKDGKIILNNQAQDGNRRPWITLALIGLELKMLDASVACEQREKDSDDIKIIIDNKIQKNDQSNWWGKNWRWQGRQLQGKTEEARFYPNLPKGIHYIEFWADRMPMLHHVSLSEMIEQGLQPKDFDMPELSARVVWDIATLRGAMVQDDSNVITELRKGEDAVVLQKATQGGRPLNSKGEALPSDRWHKVAYRDREGYVFSDALEIEGESKDDIIKVILDTSKRLKEDSALILSIAEQESQFHPYRTSEVDDPYKVGKGIMQITDQTRDEMKRNKKIDFDFKDPFNAAQNIEGGIRYVAFIRTIFEQETPDYLEKLLVAWNAGPYFIKESDRKKILDQSTIPAQTRIFIKNVKRFYQRYKKSHPNGFGRLSGLIVISAVVLTVIVVGFVGMQTDDHLSSGSVLGQSVEDSLSEDEAKHYELSDDLDTDGSIEDIGFDYWYSQERGRRTMMQLNGKFQELRGTFLEAYARDIVDDNNKEVIVDLAVGANGIWTEAYQYHDGTLHRIPVEEDGILDGFLSGGIIFVDYDDDGDMEVRSRYRVSDPCHGQSGIYEYIDGVFVLVEQVNVYEPTCRDAMLKFKG
ncbi:MAG: hypothetical protein COU72_00125 [Parcubacteria group bacterium CG10_big_fil_rev_8_21_14_0_10_41_35]|nr:MAG: hypothetical protein COU72_00125 [Parcubacteria group bacterium CG10_big_fil_rev_8_21_14_0_10_41_35]